MERAFGTKGVDISGSPAKLDAPPRMHAHQMEAADKIDLFSQMVEAARSHIGGAKIIMDSEGINDQHGTYVPSLPVTVLSALAIELQLKALARKHGAPELRTHDLERLLANLPGELQSRLLDAQRAHTGESTDDARSVLSGLKDTFVDWRYPYEAGERETRPSFLFGFALAISEYILENYNVERSLNGWMPVAVTNKENPGSTRRA